VEAGLHAFLKFTPYLSNKNSLTEDADNGPLVFQLSAQFCSSLQPLWAYVNHPKAVVVSEGNHMLSPPTFLQIQWLDGWRRIQGSTVEGVA
jgi:hypothetical protein